MNNAASIKGCGIPLFGKSPCAPIGGALPPQSKFGVPAAVTGCGISSFGDKSCLAGDNIVVPFVPPPRVYYNTRATASCPSGTTGGPFVAEAGQFSSTVSQADADAQAQAYLNSLLTTCQSQNVPAFVDCGAQGWFSSALGIPYTNSGNNTIGFVRYSGIKSLVSDGTVISNSMESSSLENTYGLPAIVMGDFSAYMEFNWTPGGGFPFGFILMDVLQQRTVQMQITANDPADESGAGVLSWCDFVGNNDAFNVLASNPDTFSFAKETWHTILVQRIGSVVSLIVDGSTIVSYDFGITFGVQIGFAWKDGGQSFQIRNIQITSP